MTAMETGSAARVAALLGDASRMTICTTLLDGRAWTAGELAGQAGIAPSTASAHLGALVRSGLLVEDRQGRHRYFRLAGPAVAQLLEDLAVVAGVQLAEPNSLPSARRARDLAWARTCYDHLAGRVGVALMDALVDGGMVDVTAGPALTPTGRAWLSDFAPGVDLSGRRRPVLRPCLDWTERRHHLGGAAAAALCSVFAERGWTRQRAGERAVTLTDAGRTGLSVEFGLDVDSLTVG
jgi:DNA-binding transcriptional ArsR family regulator